MAKLLIVDWDYFFPFFSEFNWEEIEEELLIYDMIWPIRYCSISNKRKVIARDYYNPNWFYKVFWDFVLKNSKLKMVFVVDKFKKVFKILELINEVEIYNFDQHNGTSEKINEINHYNWVTYYSDRIKSFKWFSPRWNTEEFQIKGKLLGDFREDFPSFDILFVARNSIYTSSWNDDKWLFFIKRLKDKLDNDCFAYEENSILEERYFDLNFANDWLMENQKLLSRKLERKKLLWY